MKSAQRDDEVDDADSCSYPRHNVYLDAYKIGRYEVTNAQFAEVLNYASDQGYLQSYWDEPYAGEGDSVYSHGYEILSVAGVEQFLQIDFVDGEFVVEMRDGLSMEDHPVILVTWYGAVAYCNWRSEMEGLNPVYDWTTFDGVESSHAVCRR